jgi:Uma2 family endonuclease
VLLKPRPDFYRSRFARGDDMLLVAEVNDSTLRYDRDVKVPLYARHGIPEAWIFDLQNGELLVYGALADGEYRSRTAIAQPGPMRLAALPQVTVNLSPIFTP